MVIVPRCRVCGWWAVQWATACLAHKTFEPLPPFAGLSWEKGTWSHTRSWARPNLHRTGDRQASWKYSEKRARLFQTTTNFYAPPWPCQSVWRLRLCISWEESLPRTASNSYHRFCRHWPGIERVARDSLNSGAQVTLNLQCIPYSYVLATSCMQVIEQDII